MAKDVNLPKLFGDAMKLDKDVENARQMVNEAIEKRSDSVKRIYEATGSNGPFEYNGQILQIRCRKAKDDEDNVTGETWFFVSQGDKTVTKVA